MRFVFAVISLGTFILVGLVSLPASAEEKVYPVTAVKTSPTGLRYVDENIGSGAMAKKGLKVSVHYTGWLQTSRGKRGKKFDSSLGNKHPIKFSLGAGTVIKGWEEGIEGMKTGGKRVLFVPSGLAYGSLGVAPSIPSNADLIFEVELVKVEPR